jgi:hypothetical protein
VIEQAPYKNGTGRVTAIEDLEKYKECTLGNYSISSQTIYGSQIEPIQRGNLGAFHGRAYKVIPIV